jgi:hypothetical protein
MASNVLRQDEHRIGVPPSRVKDVVVVGYDGSPNGRAALVRGARAVPQGGHLVVLRSLPAPARRPPGYCFPDPAAELYADAVASLLAATPAKLPARVTYEIRVVARSAAAALAETAERYGASEVLIGAREGPLRTDSEGIADAVTSLTRIPVEVVTARPAAAEHPRPPKGDDDLASPDPVEQRGLESFPASDPSPWWRGR